MTLNDITNALANKGYGGKDAITGRTVIESAQLNENINGDGGLSISWSSTEGGVIPAGDTLFDKYVMIEPYVPNLNDDGTYSWNPKWSEPAALLGKNYYSKELMMRRVDGVQDTITPDGTVKAVVNSDADLSSIAEPQIGDLAIVKNPDEQQGYSPASRLREYINNDGDIDWFDSGVFVHVGDVYSESSTNLLLEYTKDGWAEYCEHSCLYSHAYAGPVRTIVEDLNTFIKKKIGSDWGIILHDDEENSLGNTEVLIDFTNGSFGTLSYTNIVCTFNGPTIKQALEEIANQAGEAYTGNSAVNLYYVGKTIHLGLTDAFSAESYYNKFIVLGGTKNMAKRVATGNAYAAITQRLQLKEGTYYIRNGKVVTDTPLETDDVVEVKKGSIIDMRKNLSEAPMEKFLVWDDIYPKLNLTVHLNYDAQHPERNASRLCYMLDDNGNKIVDHWELNGVTVQEGTAGATPVYKVYCKWYITLYLDADTQYFLNTHYIIQDKPLSILFQSGPLTGQEFEVAYFSQSKPEHDVDDVSDSGHTTEVGEFRIILKSEGEILLPTPDASYANGGLCPQEGNVVTLVNVAIEDEFKEVARTELLEKGWAMAKLITSGKVASWNEKRTAPDVITGETDPTPQLGDSVGDTLDGYVVTGIETNIITGETKYSWGTFKPKGLLSGAIDQIGSLSLSGGEATFAPLVEVSNEGSNEQIIYVSNATTGGSADSSNSSSSSSSTSQASAVTIRQAGGNTNIKTVYETIDSISAETGTSEVFAGFATELWKHRETLNTDLGDNRWDSATIMFANGETPQGDYYLYSDSGGSISLVYNGDTITATEALLSAFASVKAVIEDTTSFVVTANGTIPQDPNKYDMRIEPITAYVDGEPITGGIRAWVYDDRAWELVLTSTASLIEDNGYSIRMMVFGADNPGPWITASGILTTNNYVQMFATAQIGGVSMAEALFGMGILYHVLDQGVWRDVYYDSDADKWYYTGTLEEYTGSEDNIVPYSFSKMRADKVEFDGKTIDLTSEEGIIFHSGHGTANVDALKVDGIGRVYIPTAIIQGATVSNGVFVADRAELKRYGDETDMIIKSFYKNGNETDDINIISLIAHEYGIENTKRATKSVFQMTSYDAGWTHDRGFINMYCGEHSTDLIEKSLIEMGYLAQKNIYISGDVIKNSELRDYISNCNMVAVRGRFAIIPYNTDPDINPSPDTSSLNPSNFRYGIGSWDNPVEFKVQSTDANPVTKIVTVTGGIITGIRNESSGF